MLNQNNIENSCTCNNDGLDKKLCNHCDLKNKEELSRIITDNETLISSLKNVSKFSITYILSNKYLFIIFLITFFIIVDYIVSFNYEYRYIVKGSTLLIAFILYSVFIASRVNLISQELDSLNYIYTQYNNDSPYDTINDMYHEFLKHGVDLKKFYSVNLYIFTYLKKENRDNFQDLILSLKNLKNR